MRKLFLIIGTMMQSLVVSAVTNDLPDIDMVLVEGGTFIMGCNENETDHAYESP